MKVLLPQLPARLEEIRVAHIAAETTFESVLIIGLELHDVTAPSVSFDECKLQKPLLTHSTFEKLSLRDVVVQGGDVSALSASEGGAIRVSFADARMTGFDASRSSYKNVTFKSCKLNMANFRFSKLHNVRFEDCNLTDADFQTAELTNVVFKDCQLTKVQFSNAKCNHVDLRSSTIEGLVGWKTAAVTIDSVQLMHVAHELANELNITVSDD